MRQQRGFTLLEMIVATVIMSIAVVGMLSGLAGATRNAALLRDYDRMTQLARLRMNDLIVDPGFRTGSSTSGTFDPAVTGGLDAGWSARCTLFEQSGIPHAPTPGELILDHVLLDVWWMSGSARRTFTLETVRSRVAAAGEGQ